MRTRVPLKWLALVGIVWPVLFVALVIAQGVLQPDYSHIAMPISALAAWPLGWMQNLNFLVAGALSAAFTIGVHHAIRPTRHGIIGIVLLLASSAGFVLDGLFPWINVNGVPTEPPAHALAAVITFLCVSTGLILISRRMTGDPRWHGLSAYVLSTGIVMLILFVVVGFFAVDAGTPFHSWAGLLQRVLAAVWVACIFVMASRVMRVARTAPMGTSGEAA